VLLVDDEVNRRIVEQVLQVFGCMIDVAVDGVGAVERMNLERYDLVFMEVFFAFVGSFTDLDSCWCRILSCRNWTVYRRRR
jgi:CheY-like chemotaxis protein